MIYGKIRELICYFPPSQLSSGNCGAGFALKAKAEDPDFNKNSVASIDAFMHLRNPQAAIPWGDFQEDPDEYPNFGHGAIKNNKIAVSPTNYTVPITFSGPIKDIYNSANIEKYPNNSDSQNHHVQAGQSFSTLYGTGIDRYHMRTRVGLSTDAPDNEDLFLVPKLYLGMPLSAKLYFVRAVGQRKHSFKSKGVPPCNLGTRKKTKSPNLQMVQDI